MFKMLLPVMLLLFSGGSAEVVNDFSGCGDFFKNGMTPTVFNGPQYRQICQTLNDNRYYATLYDTENRIPVYSAYKFMKNDCQVKRRDKWYIEPQLDDGINMESQGQRVLNRQASDADYASSTDRFDKGHLAPVSQSKKSQECADATFTLTNAAPQYSSFNRGQWNKIEREMITTVTNRCENYPAYIVTGVVPGGKLMNNRVNVPMCFWTAYCCQKDQVVFSGGAIGVNSKDNLRPYPLTVIELERQLAGHYGVYNFLLFDNNCKNNYVPVINYDNNILQSILDNQKECLH